MTGKINFSIRFFISIILIVLIILFVLIYSINFVLSNIKEDREYYNNFTLSEEDLNSLYETAIFECQSDEKIEFSNIMGKNFSVKCEDVNISGREGFGKVVAKGLEDSLNGIIDEKINLKLNLELAKNFIIGSLVGIIILTLLILFLAGTRGALINLGIVAIIGGSPFLVLSIISSFIRSEVENVIIKWDIHGYTSDITKIINEVLSKMHNLYLTIFVLGIILLVVGIAFIFVMKNKVEDEKIKSDIKKQKEINNSQIGVKNDN